ncbi:GNAT family N-acetyltransferase [Amycolatopsis nigrescens]|uniref:GNAT family N-acetyltransferase n=1 Tax=Amycolatopsis nigrescens TaxID=381445 RepID=UPI0003690292|nr:GNAT family N-acetyltransferase [Amycolatopsis nigrescens]
MPEIRPVRAADAPRLTGLLAQLGYPSELDAVTSRLAGVLNSATQQVLVSVSADGSRIDGYLGVERRFLLEEDERVEITGLVVDSAARRSGLGRTLVQAGEQWAVQQGLHTVVVRSNVVRPESHAFYAGIGYQRTTTSHTYRKEVRGVSGPGQA